MFSLALSLHALKANLFDAAKRKGLLETKPVK